MRKNLIIIVIIILMLSLSLCGCEQSSIYSGNAATASDMEKNFNNAMKKIVSDFVEEKSGRNAVTSESEKNYIKNYNSKLFQQHRDLIEQNDDICSSSSGGTFYFMYGRCKEKVIAGLQHLVNKQYTDAFFSLSDADWQISHVENGQAVFTRFGFEDGLCDILVDIIGYMPY